MTTLDEEIAAFKGLLSKDSTDALIVSVENIRKLGNAAIGLAPKLIERIRELEAERDTAIQKGRDDICKMLVDEYQYKPGATKVVNLPEVLRLISGKWE